MRLEHEVFVGDIEGFRTVFVLPEIPEDLSTEAKEGLTRRRQASLTGACPCGALRPKLTRQQRRYMERKHGRGIETHINIVHDSACPATDENLKKLGLKW